MRTPMTATILIYIIDNDEHFYQLCRRIRDIKLERNAKWKHYYAANWERVSKEMRILFKLI